MKILTFKDEADWLKARELKVTGTGLGKILSQTSDKPKVGFYELIANRVALKRTEENPMDRGRRLENEALVRFEKETGKKVNKDLILCVSEENDNIAYSPDGLIGKTEGVEVKCLNSAAHIEAWLTQKVPAEYYFQTIQPFIVNPKLKTLYFVYYDNRIPTKDFFYLIIERDDEVIEKYKARELAILAEVERITLMLSPI
jgi:predicted phage-related endonuclease